MNNSMINPPIMSLLNRVSDRYSLVVITAKRARQIIEERRLHPNENEDSIKPVTVAINEINEGKIRYENVKTGIK